MDSRFRGNDGVLFAGMTAFFREISPIPPEWNVLFSVVSREWKFNFSVEFSARFATNVGGEAGSYFT